MKGVLLGLTLAVGWGFTAMAADETVAPPVKGSRVTITGCVAASDADSFVLTHVQTVSPGAAAAASTATSATLGATGMEPGAGDVVYWLSKNSIKRMRGHVGHKVEVTGTVTDVGTGTLEVKEEPGKRGPDNKVEVDARGKDASVKTDRPVEPGPTPAPGAKVEKKKTLPVPRIDVDTVTMVSETCP